MGFQVLTTFTSSADVAEGRQYCFKVSAENAASYTTVNPGTFLAARSQESDEVCEYAAGVPGPVETVVLRRVVALQIVIDWVSPKSDNGSPIVYYEVYGKSSGQLNFDLIATSSAGYTQAVYEGCWQGDTYTFYVRAKNAVGFGPNSPQVVGRCAIAPAEPVNLERTASSMTSATLQWSASPDDNGAPITGYSLFYQVKGTQSKTRIYSSTALSFTHSPIITGVTYIYTVTALNEAGESRPSAEASVLAATLPGRPWNLRVIDRTRSTMILGWNPPSTNGGTPITYYELYYGTTVDDISTLAWRGLALNSANITFVEGNSYFFQVAACNGVTSVLGGCVRDTSPTANKLFSYAAEIPPEIPVLYLISSTLNTLTVGWNSVVTDTGAEGMDLLGFKLYADDGRGGAIKTLVCDVLVPELSEPNKELRCSRTGLAGGVKFRYQLVVVNPVGESMRGPISEFRTCDIPYAPRVFEVASRVEGAVNVTWSNIPLTTCPVTSYQVLRGSGTPSSADDCASATFTTVIGEPLLPHFQYITSAVETMCLRVRAQNWQTENSAVVGEMSAPMFVKTATAPSPPKNLARVTSTSSSITIKWDTPESDGGEDIIGYEVAYNDGQGGDLVQKLSWSDPGVIDVEITGLVYGRLYGVKVRAKNYINLENPLTDNADCCWSEVKYFWAAATSCQPLVADVTPEDTSRSLNGFTLKWS
jgi:hypothetical protein